MAPTDRGALAGLRRSELQNLCKEHGIKGGNQKKDILVNLLVAFFAQTMGPAAIRELDEERGNRPETKRRETTTRQSSKSAPSSKPPLTSSRSSVHSKTETLAVTSQPSAWSRRAAVTADREPDPPVLEDLGEVATEESNAKGSEHEQAAASDPLPPSDPAGNSAGHVHSSLSSQSEPTIELLATQIAHLPTRTEYTALLSQLSALQSLTPNLVTKEDLVSLSAKVSLLPTREEYERFVAQREREGWVTRDEVEELVARRVEERMSTVEARLQALESSARIAALTSAGTASEAEFSLGSSISSLGKRSWPHTGRISATSPTVSFADLPRTGNEERASLASAGRGNGRAAYGLGLGGPGLDDTESETQAAKKARTVSAQSEMDAGLVEGMLPDDGMSEADVPSLAGSIHTPMASTPPPTAMHSDPLITSPAQQSPCLPPFGGAATPLVSFQGISQASMPPLSTSKNAPQSAMPFPLFATSPRPPTRLPTSPSLGYLSPRKAAATSAAAQAAAVGSLTPGRQLFSGSSSPRSHSKKPLSQDSEFRRPSARVAFDALGSSRGPSSDVVSPPYPASPAASSSTSLLPPFPMDAPFSLSPSLTSQTPSGAVVSGGGDAFPFAISPDPRARSTSRSAPGPIIPPTPPAQKTLYGTERELDSRFGDEA